MGQPPRRGAAVVPSVLALALLGASPAVQEPRAYLQVPPRDPVRFARAVAQEAFDVTGYQGTDPSGRFAVLGDVVVDLASERVAWRRGLAMLPLQTARHQILNWDRDLPDGVELWDVLSGESSLFPGTLVRHIGMAERFAVQRGSVLDIIDTLRGARVASFSTLGEVLSVVASGTRWLVLERTGSTETERLRLSQALPAPEAGLASQSLELPPTPFSFGLATDSQSQPFLAVDGSGLVSVCILETRRTPDAPDQRGLWRSELDLTTGRGKPWSVAPVDVDRPPVVLPFYDPYVSERVPPPERVQQHLSRVRTTPDLAIDLDVSSDARYAISTGVERACYWALDRAERSWCEAPHADPVFLDSSRAWWRGDSNDVEQVIGVLDLPTRRRSTRSFATEALILLGSNERLLMVSANDQHMDTFYAFEVWTFGGRTPLWTHPGCANQPHFIAGGAQIACVTGQAGDEPSALVLDASNGRLVNDSAPASVIFGDHRPCLGVAPGREPTIWLDGVAVASLYDLTPTEWAIVLPDGRFHGTRGASSFLAFYTPSGTLLSRRQVETLRDSRAVRKVVAALPHALEQCLVAGGRR